MSVDTRLTFSLGTDGNGRVIQFIRDGSGFALRRGAGEDTPMVEIPLSADQLRDMAHVAGLR